MFVAAVATLTGVTAVLIGRIYVLDWNSAALWRAWVEQRLEAAVVDQLLAVLVQLESTIDAQALDIEAVDGQPVDSKADHKEPVPKRPVPERPVDPYWPLEVTGEVRALLTSAAAAVEHHLPGLIESRPPHTAQARAITHEVATFLLELRSAADLPNGRVGDSDLTRVSDAFEPWIVGSLADLPRASTEGTDTRSQRRVTGP
jgi:hypothetical protein